MKAVVEIGKSVEDEITIEIPMVVQATTKEEAEHKIREWATRKGCVVIDINIKEV